MNPVFLVLPCFNEEEALPHFFLELAPLLESIPDRVFFTVWVDDGSNDGTWKVIGSLPESSRIRHHGVSFVRNYGHQAAIQAGCEFVARHPSFSPESRVLILDSDGQHPVAEIPRILRELDVSRHVQMIRKDTAGVGRTKKSSSSLFYRVFRTFTGMDLPDGAADFRGLQGSVLLNYLQFSESGRFNRGLFHLTEPPFFLSYEARARHHGTSKYTLSKMLRLAFIGITNFSNRPLILASFAATAFGFTVCIGYFLFEFYRLWNGRMFQPGWFTIMAWISMWGMILSFCMLLLSIYVGRIFDETKKRPIYLIKDKK
jgi:glycosyltransferase involved in cell wall biosynthesis